MAEFVKASAAPECLCGIRHWSTERDKCKFHERAPEPTPQPIRKVTCSNTDSAAKHGVETSAIKTPSRKQPSDKTSKKGETPARRGNAVKKAGRPRKRKAA